MPELFRYCSFIFSDKLPEQNEKLREYISDTLNFRICKHKPLTIEKENVTHQDCLKLIETLKAEYEPEVNDSIFVPSSERHCNQILATSVPRNKKNVVDTKNISPEKTLGESNIQSEDVYDSEDIKDIVSQNISNQPSSSSAGCMEISETSKKALAENLEHLLLGSSVVTAQLSPSSDVQAPQEGNGDSITEYTLNLTEELNLKYVKQTLKAGEWNFKCVKETLKDLHASVDPQKSCQICFDDGGNLYRTRCCEVLVCSECEIKISTCPFCRHFWRIIKGIQPDGSMKVEQLRESADGYEHFQAWKIEYYFPSGRQKDHHPNPGKFYSSCKRVAYLPANDKGFLVLTLLRLSFIRRLTFTIGSSLTTSREDAITWNDIHHKTSLNSGIYGYPDPTYMQRVVSELADKGVRFDTMTDEEKRDIDDFRYCLQKDKRFYK